MDQHRITSQRIRKCTTGILVRLRKPTSPEFLIKVSISQIGASPNKLFTVLRAIAKRKHTDEIIRAPLNALLRWQVVTFERACCMWKLKAEVINLLTAQSRPARYVNPTP
jgi:hypothetical protein